MVSCGCCGKPIKVTRDKHFFDEKTKKRYHLGCIVDICEHCGKPIKKGTKYENEHGNYYHEACFRRKESRENPEGLHVTEKEDFMRWWSQGLSLGLIRYDGKILDKPSAPRFANWWVQGTTWGFLKVNSKGIDLQKGDSIVDEIARSFTLGIAAYGNEPTSRLRDNPPDPARFVCSECGCPIDLRTDDAFVSDGGAVHMACYKGKAPERMHRNHEHGQGEWFDWGTGEARHNPIGPVLVAGAKVVGEGMKKAAIAGADAGGKGMVLTGKGMVWSGEKLQESAKKARGNPMKIASSKDIEELVGHFKKEYPKLPESTWDDFRAVCFEQRGAGKTKLKGWWTKTLRANSERLGCRKNPLPLIPIIAGMVAPKVIEEGSKLAKGMTAPKEAVKNPKLKIGVGNSEVELKSKLGL